MNMELEECIKYWWLTTVRRTPPPDPAPFFQSRRGAGENGCVLFGEADVARGVRGIGLSLIYETLLSAYCTIKSGGVNLLTQS